MKDTKGVQIENEGWDLWTCKKKPKLDETLLPLKPVLIERGIQIEKVGILRQIQASPWPLLPLPLLGT
jgi:hypothetical protein